MANEVIRMGGYVEKAALDAFEEGALNLRSKEFMNIEAKNVIFNHKKYESWEALKAAKIPNYMSIVENLDEVEGEIEALLEFGMVREIEEFDDEHVISPIHYIKSIQADGKVKSRLVFHDKANFMYARGVLKGICKEKHKLDKNRILRTCTNALSLFRPSQNAPYHSWTENSQK